MIENNEKIPIDYRDFIVESLPYRFRDRLLDPAVLVRFHDNNYYLELGAFIRKRNKLKFHPCDSIKHNWLIADGVIYPLPKDSPVILEERLKEYNLDKLTLPQVTKILRDGIEGFNLVLSEEAIVPAKDRSKILTTSKIEGLEANLFEYQKQGVAWLKEKVESVHGAILSDEMGLGKTLQIIALMLLCKPTNINPALIICPTSLIENWKRELHKFSPCLSVLIHQGTERSGYYRDLMRSNIVITTYDTLVNDQSVFMGIDWTYVICDEAQAVKNPQTNRRMAVASLSRQYTIPVTGTPIENTLVDFWSLADLAIPGIFGSLEEFSEHYPNNLEGAGNLRQIADGLILKRTVSEVAADLPPRIDIDLPIALSTNEIRQYEQLRNNVIEQYGRAGQLVSIGQLSLYCAHPSLVTDSSVIDDNFCNDLKTPKIEHCLRLLREAFQNDRKVLIFSTYNRLSGILKDALQVSGIEFKYWNSINGSTPQEDRQRFVDEFTMCTDKSVLVLNPKAAGAGLNITSATVVIHYTQNWNPAIEMQASARAHRRGQTMPVTIYRLYYAGTVEEVMIERSNWKKILGSEALPLDNKELCDQEHALKISPKENSNE